MYSIFGYLKDKNCNPIANARVMPYFKKVDSGSSASKWSSSPYYTDSQGYYTFDIEDVQLLGVTGAYKKGTDKVYIAISYNSNNINEQNKDSLNLTHATFVEHVTVAATDFYRLNLDLLDKRLPVVNSTTFPAVELKTSTNYTMAETSSVDYGWVTGPCNSSNVSQKLVFDLVPIFDGHQLTTTLYDWGEVVTRTIANNSSNTYTYNIAGVYEQCITVREKWDTEVKQCQQVTVRYNKPVPNFNWSPTQTNSWQGARLKGQELVTFTNTSSDKDDRTWDNTKWGAETYTYTWTITDTNQDGTDNTKVYTAQTFGYTPTHQFQSVGTKTITLNVHWNDGFDNYTETVVKTLEIHAFDIVPDLKWDKIPTNRAEEVTFSPDTTTGDVDKIVGYAWTIEDSYPESTATHHTFGDGETSIYWEHSNNPAAVVDNTYSSTEQYPQVKLHSIEPKQVEVVITYYNGWTNVTKSISKIITPTKTTLNALIGVSNYSPKGRDVEVVLSNDTIEKDKQYWCDWVIQDKYAIYNPDNPEYGALEKDNTVEHEKEPEETVSHYFQSKKTHGISLVVWYDDGYQMTSTEAEVSMNPSEYEIVVSIVGLTEYVGRQVIDYNTVITNVDMRNLISENWLLIDKDLDGVEYPDERLVQIINAVQSKDWEYPSYRPISSTVGQGTVRPKEINVVVRYDNGWEDTATRDASKTTTAKTKEVSSIITVNTNIEGYTH